MLTEYDCCSLESIKLLQLGDCVLESITWGVLGNCVLYSMALFSCCISGNCVLDSIELLHFGELRFGFNGIVAFWKLRVEFNGIVASWYFGINRLLHFENLRFGFHDNHCIAIMIMIKSKILHLLLFGSIICCCLESFVAVWAIMLRFGNN